MYPLCGLLTTDPHWKHMAHQGQYEDPNPICALVEETNGDPCGFRCNSSLDWAGFVSRRIAVNLD